MNKLTQAGLEYFKLNVCITVMRNDWDSQCAQQGIICAHRNKLLTSLCGNNSGHSDRLYFFGLQNHWMMITAMKLKDTPWKKTYDQPRQHIKKQRHYFANKGPSSQGYGFSSGHVWM